MEFRRERVVAEFLDPRRSFARTRAPVEIRWNPLTGESCRLLPEGSLPPPAAQDVAAMAAQTRPECPFCPERIWEATPRFPPELSPEGRFARGEAVSFPNLVPYAKWSSVSVYSPALHLLPLDELTPALIADNLATQRDFAAAVRRHDPASRWVSVNANQLPPSGSSIFHPHLQGAVNPEPTTVQRRLAAAGCERMRTYVEAEKESGERLIASAGRTSWLAAFAPIGPAELLALVEEASSPEELDDQVLAEVASGLSAALRLYAALGLQSFNLALYGAPRADARPLLLLRVVGRAYIGPHLRSDAMWSERLHAEAAVDVAPETVADRGRAVFGLL